MAERRMFARTIIDSDAFLDMPASTQSLYFHLGMRADDEGFVNAPKRIMRTVGCSEDDLRLLIAKRFLIPFDSGVVVIKHWRIHNYIRGDRLKPTAYEEERAALTVKKNGAYTVDGQMAVTCQTNVSQVSDKCQSSVSIGKDSIGKVSIGEVKKGKRDTPARVTRPSVDEVKEYANAIGISLDPQAFVDYYDANGWKVGKNPMKDWKAAARNWARRDKEKAAPKSRKTTFHNLDERDNTGESWDDLIPFMAPHTDDNTGEEASEWEDMDAEWRAKVDAMRSTRTHTDRPTK